MNRYRETYITSASIEEVYKRLSLEESTTARRVYQVTLYVLYPGHLSQVPCVLDLQLYPEQSPETNKYHQNKCRFQFYLMIINLGVYLLPPVRFQVSYDTWKHNGHRRHLLPNPKFVSPKPSPLRFPAFPASLLPPQVSTCTCTCGSSALISSFFGPPLFLLCRLSLLDVEDSDKSMSSKWETLFAGIEADDCLFITGLNSKSSKSSIFPVGIDRKKAVISASLAACPSLRTGVGPRLIGGFDCRKKSVNKVGWDAVLCRLITDLSWAVTSNCGSSFLVLRIFLGIETTFYLWNRLIC